MNRAARFNTLVVSKVEEYLGVSLWVFLTIVLKTVLEIYIYFKDTLIKLFEGPLGYLPGTFGFFRT